MFSTLLDDLRGDVPHALRGLMRSPGFTAAAVITLGLGIGAATAVLSVVNTVLLEPLPYKDADRLVRIVERAAPANPSAPLLRRTGMSWAVLTAWRKESKTLSEMAFSITPPITLMPTEAGSARLTGGLVSPHLFAMLGAGARLGRTLDAADDAAGSNVVVISTGAWQRYFQGDPGILGRTITLKTMGPEAGFLDGTPLTIVGVMPASFDFPLPNMDYWAPITNGSPAQRLGGNVIARLQAGTSIAAATDEANAIGEGVRPKPTSGPLSRPLPPGERRFVVEAVKEQIVAAKPPGPSRDCDRRWCRAADSVRERRQPAARPRHLPTARDRGAPGDRRQPRAHPPAVHHREPVARADRRRARRRAGGRVRRRAARVRVAPRARRVPTVAGVWRIDGAAAARDRRRRTSARPGHGPGADHRAARRRDAGVQDVASRSCAGDELPRCRRAGPAPATPTRACAACSSWHR